MANLGLRHRCSAWLLSACGHRHAKGGRLPHAKPTWDAAWNCSPTRSISHGPNDQGIGWNILNSLQTRGIGFGLAALVGIPLGFIIGRFDFRTA